MADPLSSGPVPAPSFSWVAEIMQRVPAYTFMAGLFVYWILVVSPKREAWWWEQMQTHERDQAATAQVLLGRQEAALRELEIKCYNQIADNRMMTIENRKTITDNYNLLMAQQAILNDYAKILDDIKAMIRRTEQR